MPSQNTLSSLCTILVDLYETDADARRMISDAGMKAASINFNSSANNVWLDILSEAHKHRIVHVIVENAAKEYKAREQELWAAYNSYSGEQIGINIDDTPKGVISTYQIEPGNQAAIVQKFDLDAILSAEHVLQEALATQELVLFIGADLPQHLTGLPSRADLARGLAKIHNVNEGLSLAEVAQRVSRGGNRFAFTSYLRSQLGGIYKPQPVHHQLARLIQAKQIETIISTTYDTLLEIALQQIGIAVNRVVTNSDVALIFRQRPTLYKLYGDLQQPESLVVTDQDHGKLLRDQDRDAVLDSIRVSLRRNTVLFIGHNLSDPDFRFLFDEIAGNLFARTAYAVWPDMDEATQSMWRDRGIVVLE